MRLAPSCSTALVLFGPPSSSWRGATTDWTSSTSPPLQTTASPNGSTKRSSTGTAPTCCAIWCESSAAPVRSWWSRGGRGTSATGTGSTRRRAHSRPTRCGWRATQPRIRSCTRKAFGRGSCGSFTLGACGRRTRGTCAWIPACTIPSSAARTASSGDSGWASSVRSRRAAWTRMRKASRCSTAVCSPAQRRDTKRASSMGSTCPCRGCINCSAQPPLPGTWAASKRSPAR